MGSEPSVFAPRVQAGDSPAGPAQPSERLAALLEISSDWYWEQDEQFRFTVLRGRAHKPPGMGVESYIGSTRWDHGEVPVADGGQWDAHRAQLAAHQPFAEFVLKRVNRDGELRFISSSGVPVFDADGSFKGYCGVAKDVTVAMRDQLQRTLQHGVTLALAASDNVREAAARILRFLCETCDWVGGACFALDAEQQRVGVIETWAAAPGSALAAVLDRVKAAPMLPADAVVQTYPSWVTGRPAWLDPPTPQSCQLAQPEVLAQGIRGAFCVPIKVDGRVSGMLELLSRSRVTPDPGLPEVAELLGSQMGEFTRRALAQRRLRESEERFRALVELSSDWYWEQDENLRFTKFAGSGGALPFEQIRGKTRWELPIVATEEQWAAHKARLAAHLPFRDLELQVIAADGSKRYSSVSGRPLFDRSGRFKGYHGLSRDITARKLSEERIEYLANHDALTGLPNRSMFSTVLNLTINSARRYARQFALVFVDLDRFKLINDTLGHQAGDALLQEIAKRLSQGLRGSDVVARLGGDEFVVLVQEIAEEQQAASVARKILSAVMQPMVLLGQECRVTASVGVTMFPRDAQDEPGLMKNADPMYLAKEEGKNNFQFFSKEIRTHTLERLTLESALRRALERGELTLHYQAKLDLLSGRITGAEALLRWTNAELGVVSPAQFIPVAEETGLIVPIGRWVLRSACAQNVAWQREGLAPLCIAVNLSPRQFFDEFLLRDILAVLDETGMDPGLLELEITEGMVMQDSRRTSQLLAHIKGMGVRLAIDDFGTGYSSLAQIKRFPIDTIKVDRSFIRNLPLDAEDKAITQAIIAMGKTLSLTVVAEGVETEAQEAFLREHDCDQTQGYYFSKPVDAAEFAQLLHRHRA